MIAVYLAGPMRGIANFNFPAFDYAAAKLREQGFEVFSPAERDRAAYGEGIENNPTGDENLVANSKCTIEDCMEADAVWICRHANAVALLPGWEKSSGANAELALAKALGLSYIVLGKEYVKMRGDCIGYNEGSNARANLESRAAAPPKNAPFVPLSLADSKQRKMMPVLTGFMDYFPDAIAAVSYVSYMGNQKHNPGQALHWARGKSDDHEDCVGRHLLRRAGVDQDNIDEMAEAAWRIMAALQLKIEKQFKLPPSPGSAPPA